MMAQEHLAAANVSHHPKAAGPSLSAAPPWLSSSLDDVTQFFEIVERLNFHRLGRLWNSNDERLSLVSFHCRVNVREIAESVFQDQWTFALIFMMDGEWPLGAHHNSPSRLWSSPIDRQELRLFVAEDVACKHWHFEFRLRPDRAPTIHSALSGALLHRFRREPGSKYSARTRWASSTAYQILIRYNATPQQNRDSSQ
jgi:hypothetical protein